MNQAQMLRRQALLDQQDAAFENFWPQRGGYLLFVSAFASVAENLEQLARKADSTSGNPIEHSQTYGAMPRSLIQEVSFGMNEDELDEQLIPAIVAFKKSEDLMQGIDDPIEKMKLDFAYGRALFRLSHGRDLNLARQARDRLASALQLARLYSPMHVQSAERSILNAESGLELVEEGVSMDEQIVELAQSLKKKSAKS